MKTIVYMVRHAESPYTEGNERTRGLTDNGKLKAITITEILKDEGIDAILSSPYARAILSLDGLAEQLDLEIKTYEDLRERHFTGEDYIISYEEVISSIKKNFDDYNFALPGGESNSVCQNRSVEVLKKILEEYKGKKIAIGTHGNVMTLMMNYYDSKYGLEFLNQTKKPDIYKLEFEGQELIEVTRLWDEKS